MLSSCSSFAGAVVLAPFFVLFAFGLCSPESVPHRDSIGNVRATLARPAAGCVLVRETTLYGRSRPRSCVSLSLSLSIYLSIWAKNKGPPQAIARTECEQLGDPMVITAIPRYSRMARRRRKNPTDVNSFFASFCRPTDVNSFFAPFCRPTDVKRFCRPNRCQALLQKTGEAREVSPSRSSPFEATPPGTDVTPPTCTGVYMLFFSGFEAMPL